jgi:tetraacyldisaccharide 4'-kinase
MSRSVWGSLLQPAVVPASWAYGAGVAARTWLYRSGTLSTKRLPAPVVSVGNMTWGGSGKTPLVAGIARHFLARGRAVGVLSRGYRREHPGRVVVVSEGQSVLVTAAEGGDEPVELAELVPGLAVAVGADRYEAGLELLRRGREQVFVLDDGFQHRRLARDLDLVCIDAGEPEDHLRLLPAGRLREPLSNLERAGAFIWTRWREGRPTEALRSRVLPWLADKRPVFRSVSAISGFQSISSSSVRLPAEGLRGESIGMLSGMAKPGRFREDLEECGARIVWSCTKRDHYRWRAEEVGRLVEEARCAGARAVVTTGKDAVKMKAVEQTSVPLYRALIESRVLEAQAFEALLDAVPRAPR